MLNIKKICFALVSLSLLASCQHTNIGEKQPLSSVEETFAYCYALSQQSISQPHQILLCAQKSLAHHLDKQAEQSLHSLHRNDLNQEEYLWRQILLAELALHKHRYQQSAKLLQPLNPNTLNKPLRNQWLALEAKLSQINRHWLKALEFTLLLPNQENTHTKQLWRLAQLSLSEPSASISKEAKTWIDLAKILITFDGKISTFDKKIRQWKGGNPHHQANSLLTRTEKEPTSMSQLCLDDQDPKKSFNKGLTQAFFDDKHGKKIQLLWDKPNKTLSSCHTIVHTSANKPDYKNWVVSPPFQQQSWKNQEYIAVTHKLQDLGRSHPIIIYEREQKNKSQHMLKALKSANIQSTAILATNQQEDHTQAIKSLMGLDSSKPRYEQIRSATWTPMSVASTRRQDFDSIILFSSYEEASKIIPLLRFFYADDIPTVLIPSNHLHSKQKLSDIAGTYVLDSYSPDEKPYFHYGYNAYLLAKYQTLLRTYPDLSIATQDDNLSLAITGPLRQTLWKQATKQGLMLF